MPRRFYLPGKPMPLTAQKNCKAWAYGHSGGVDVYIQTLETGPTVTCTLTKRQVAAYLRRIAAAEPSRERCPDCGQLLPCRHGCMT